VSWGILGLMWLSATVGFILGVLWVAFRPRDYE
jgi:hypothetical protein